MQEQRPCQLHGWKVEIATCAQAQGLTTEGCFELAVAQEASRFASLKSDEVDDRKPAARERDEVPDVLKKHLMTKFMMTKVAMKT